MHTTLGKTALFVALALGLGADAQTNLLLNADLETNAGFSGEDPNCQDFWGSFCGFDDWNTDFTDNGVFDFSWDSTTPGGIRLANVFPAGDAPTDPVLTGESSALILGSFDASTSSVLAQQIAVNAGDTYRIGMFAYSDSTQTTASGFPDTVFAFTENKLALRAEFYDVFGTGGFAEDAEQVIFDPANQGFDFQTGRNELLEDKWQEAAVTVTVPVGASFLRLAAVYDQVNNAGGLAFFDTTSIVNLSAGTPAEGDFDFDGDLDADDLGMLTLAVDGLLVSDADDGDRFDLSGDTSLTQDDIVAWQALAPAVGGDFNGDGRVDNTDLNLLLNNWGQTSVPAEWINGLTDAVNNDELNALLDNWGTGTGGMVPEPSTLVVGLLTLVGLAGSRQR